MLFRSIASAYRIKSGMAEDDLLAMMDKETWLTAERALELKLIDEVMFTNQAPQLVASTGGMIPPAVIDKMRNMLADKKPDNSNLQREYNARLNLLKLRGKTE